MLLITGHDYTKVKENGRFPDHQYSYGCGKCYNIFLDWVKRHDWTTLVPDDRAPDIVISELLLHSDLEQKWKDIIHTA